MTFNLNFLKPTPHLELNDWNCRLNELSRTSALLCQDSADFRQGSRKLCTDTRIDGEFTTQDTNLLLRERILELRQWRSSLETTYKDIQKQSEVLAREKLLIEDQIEALKKPTAILRECLTQRDCREGSELTNDDADMEIKNELRVLESNQQVLTERCENIWRKLTHLDKVKYKISIEIDNKKEAEAMDEEQLRRDRFTESNMYKMNATRDPKNCVDYKRWLEHTRSIKQMALDELADAYAIRDSLTTARQKAITILKTQQDRTDHAIRMRLNEMRRACNELEWQQTKIRNELSLFTCEIRAQEQSIRSMEHSLKLVETRLENRSQRSGVELTMAQAHYGLLIESRRLRQNIRSLAHHLKKAQYKFQQLSHHANTIDIDLERKKNSVATDLKTLKMREALKSTIEAKKSQPDRNLELTRSEDAEKITNTKTEGN